LVVWTVIRRLFCFNHDYAMCAEPGVIFLRCRRCAHRTTGWTLDARIEARGPRVSGMDRVTTVQHVVREPSSVV
jgi:hypothetical protein